MFPFGETTRRESGTACVLESMGKGVHQAPFLQLLTVLQPDFLCRLAQTPHFAAPSLAKMDPADEELEPLQTNAETIPAEATGASIKSFWPTVCKVALCGSFVLILPGRNGTGQIHVGLRYQMISDGFRMFYHL